MTTLNDLIIKSISTLKKNRIKNPEKSVETLIKFFFKINLRQVCLDLKKQISEKSIKDFNKLIKKSRKVIAFLNYKLFKFEI